MSAPNELYPPAQYEWWWLLIAVAIVAVLAAAAWLVWALTRPPAPPAPATPLPLNAQLDALRVHHLGRIDRVEDAIVAGAMSGREANAELSRITRAFVGEFTGLEAPVLSLDDLEARGASPDLVEAIRHLYYPSVYGRGDPADPAIGLAAARRVVTGWH